MSDVELHADEIASLSLRSLTSACARLEVRGPYETVPRIGLIDEVKPGKPDM